MNTGNKSIQNDKGFFWIVLGISLVVPAVVIVLRFLPEQLRPNALFAVHLPAANAVINSMVTVTLLTGYVIIKRTKNKIWHRFFMLSSLILSCCFLVSYIVYHTVMPHTNYCGEGWMKYFYFFILITHIGLAALNLPMVLYTVYFSTSGKIEKHRRIARWTFPLWLYVSVTGILVYLLISPCYPF